MTSQGAIGGFCRISLAEFAENAEMSPLLGLRIVTQNFPTKREQSQTHLNSARLLGVALSAYSAQSARPSVSCEQRSLSVFSVISV